MKVLGISCYYHDAAAALVVDGQIIAASEEERFTRKKHDANFPVNAIRECLRQGGIGIDDIDLVCFYEKPLRKLERVLVCGAAFQSADYSVTENQISKSLKQRLFVPEVLKVELGYRGQVNYVEHHLAHAASAFFGSKAQSAAVLTIDGVGEWTSTAIYKGEGHTIAKLREIHYPNSLGLFYSTMTAYLGFKVNNDEYKVMGLASYGTPRYVDELRQLIHFHDDGSFRLNLDFFEFHKGTGRMFSDALVKMFGESRIPESGIDDLHKDLASSTQALLEEGVLALVTKAHELTRGETLCMAGGVALNCVANARIKREGPFKDVWVQPAAGDGGGSLGAALYAWHTHASSAEKEKHQAESMTQRYSTTLGPQWSAQQIRETLDQEDAIYTEFDEQALIEKTADLLAESYIIGWYQGRMEFGPRALGNRSILANPTNPDMQQILNSRVKFREEFRPFAPAVRAEDAQDWFEIEEESPFMLFAPSVKEGVGEKLPSITHVDNTARVQTVASEDNKKFHQLLTAWKQRTGVPVLINTSFNVRGEPIVCSPADAYRCFLRTDIDFLIMDNFLVEKEA